MKPTKFRFARMYLRNTDVLFSLISTLHHNVSSPLLLLYMNGRDVGHYTRTAPPYGEVVLAQFWVDKLVEGIKKLDNSGDYLPSKSFVKAVWTDDRKFSLIDATSGDAWYIHYVTQLEASGARVYDPSPWKHLSWTTLVFMVLSSILSTLQANTPSSQSKREEDFLDR